MNGHHSGWRGQHTLSCPFTPECLRLLDQIDALNVSCSIPSSVEHIQSVESLQVTRLAEHIQGCKLCQRATAQQRRRREQQRALLRELLVEGEQIVPSSTMRILTALKRENATLQQIETPPPVPRLEHPVQSPFKPDQPATASRLRAGTLVAVVVAVLLILTSISVFGLLRSRTNTASTTQQLGSHTNTASTTQQLHFATDWTSLLLTRLSPDRDQRIVENYEAISGKHTQLFPGCCSTHAIIDGAAHNGHNIVYHEVKGNSTTYSLLSGQSYTVDGRGTNAAWSTFDQYIFVATEKAFIQIDVNNGRQVQQHVALQAFRLELYRDTTHLLYFTRLHPENAQLLDLYSIKMDTNGPAMVNGPLATGPISTHFWLDLSDTPIHYVKAEAGQHNLYAVESDGSNDRLLQRNATPIGYANDGTLMYMRYDQDKFSVHQLASGSKPDVIGPTLLDNVAPGAKSLCNTPAADGVPVCDQSIALSPYARSLVIGASYADGRYVVTAIDVQTKGKTALPLLQLNNRPEADVQLIGWDKILAS